MLTGSEAPENNFLQVAGPRQNLLAQRNYMNIIYKYINNLPRYRLVYLVLGDIFLYECCLFNYGMK